MSTVRDIINGAMRLLGVLSRGQTLQDGIEQDCLVVLNELLEAWSIEHLMVYAFNRATYSLVPSTSSYTLGAAGTLVGTRPSYVEGAKVIPVGTTTEVDLELLTPTQWQNISLKSTQGTFPTALFADPGTTTWALEVWPVPTTAATLVLYTRDPITAFTSVGQTITLPPGYTEALKYGLAKKFAPEVGREAPPDVMQGAADAKARIKTINKEVLYTEYDAYIPRATRPYISPQQVYSGNM